MAKKRPRVMGTFLPRIDSEQETYPVEKFGTVEDWAGVEEMTAAGFPRQATGTVIDQDGNEIDMGDLRFGVLREQGKIVATWDEGRWWTPYESARLIQQYVRDAKTGSARHDLGTSS